MEINWDSPTSRITEHFTVHEALWLPSIEVYHKPTYTEKANIVKLASQMEQVRSILGKPIHVHCWIRPTSVDVSHPLNVGGIKLDGFNYNKHVGGADNSMHIYGRACDFHVDGNETIAQCKAIRLLILPYLNKFNIRMENKEGNWIHIDNKEIKRGNRFFIP